jgi:hypothetical protein
MFYRPVDLAAIINAENDRATELATATTSLMISSHSAGEVVSNEALYSTDSVSEPWSTAGFEILLEHRWALGASNCSRRTLIGSLFP